MGCGGNGRTPGGVGHKSECGHFDTFSGHADSRGVGHGTGIVAGMGRRSASIYLRRVVYDALKVCLPFRTVEIMTVGANREY